MRPRDYLVGVDELRIRVVENAHADIMQVEALDADGLGTNRGEYPDRVNARFGSPLGSPWCANAGASWWKDAGAELPPEPGSCDSWLAWAFKTGRFRHAPREGYAAIYGTLKDANHWEVVARLVRDLNATWGARVITIGGNTSIGTYNRDGWIVTPKVLAADRLVGFIAPRATDP